VGFLHDRKPLRERGAKKLKLTRIKALLADLRDVLAVARAYDNGSMTLAEARMAMDRAGERRRLAAARVDPDTSPALAA
jgi:hypothetical protein